MQTYKKTVHAALMDSARLLLKANALLTQSRAYVAKDIKESGLEKIYRGYLQNIRTGRKLRHDLWQGFISRLSCKLTAIATQPSCTFIKPANFPTV